MTYIHQKTLSPICRRFDEVQVVEKVVEVPQVGSTTQGSVREVDVETEPTRQAVPGDVRAMWPCETPVLKLLQCEFQDPIEAS